jgi:hypothetical protein
MNTRDFPALPWREALMALIDKFDPVKRIVDSPDMTEWRREVLVGLIGIDAAGLFRYETEEFQKLVWDWLGEYLSYLYVRLAHHGVVLASLSTMDANGNLRPRGDGKIYVKLSGANASRWLLEVHKKKCLSALEGLKRVSTRNLRRPDLWLPYATPGQLTRARLRVPLLNDAMNVQFRSVVASVEDVCPGELPSLPFLPSGTAPPTPTRRNAARASATSPRKRGRPRKWKNEAERRAAEMSKRREKRHELHA